MHVPARVGSALFNKVFTPKILITFGIGRLFNKYTLGHPARWPCTIRVSTHEAAHVPSSKGGVYPFWPVVASIGEITHSINRSERRIESNNINIEILNSPAFRDKFNNIFLSSTVWCQIDLWFPNTYLEEAIPLVAGRATFDFKSDNGNITFSVTDGYDGIVGNFPFSTEKIDKDEFGNVPDNLASKQPRRVLHGELKDIINTYQINKEGTEFYIAEPSMRVPPNQFFVDDKDVTNEIPMSVITDRTLITNQSFSKVVLQKPLAAYGYSGTIFVRGGAGGNPFHPIYMLINDIPNLRLTKRAQLNLYNLDVKKTFDLYMVYEAGGDPFDILFNRILPQANMAGGFLAGELDIVDLTEKGTYKSAVLGGNLIAAEYESSRISPEDVIYNSIEIKYRKKHTNPPDDGTYGLNRYILDETVPSALNSYIIKSQRNFGKRHLVVDAADLYRPEDAKLLSNEMMKITTQRHNNYFYATTYTHGMNFSHYQGIKLTDSTRNLNNVKCRLVSKTYYPTHMLLGFQTEDI